MSSLFSHAPEPVPENDSVPAARSAVAVVPLPIAEAFDGFTDGIHLWWPMNTHSGFGGESHVGFEDGFLVEDSFTGTQCMWGEVQLWEEPASLVLKWQLGDNPLTPTIVGIDFTAVGESSTTVTLKHDGWTPGEVGHEQYEKYCDWPLILSRYARFMGGALKLD